jgi:hypothetical protein
MIRIFWSAILTVLLSGTLSSQQAPRVYVSDSQSWEVGGGFGVGKDGGSLGGAGGFRGGARPQTVEVMKTFQQRCPEVTITSDKAKADFVVLFDHEGGKGLLRDNKIAVFNGQGDLIKTSSTRVLGNAVKDACKAILPAPGN